jgi:16S rRNA (guanine966-N2)-methyltransferase
VRVIAGTAGGLPLKTPRTGLRPTMDKVRGAIFDSLGEFIVGARVLDLFAGCGSLGIEALSRGAESVSFVELERRGAAAIRENLARTRLTGEVIGADVFRYLERAAPAGFDLILADPPYAKAPGERDFAAELLASEPLCRTLAADGIFVLEHLPGVALAIGPHWECVRDKRYGATAVAFLRKTSGLLD